MSRSSRVLISLLAGGAILTGGCRSAEPDLTALYADAAGVERPPVVVVHGVLGARLQRSVDGREIWPGGFWRLLTHDYRDLALPIDPETLEPVDDGITAYDFFDRAAGADFYGKLLATLNGPGGYVTKASALGRNRMVFGAGADKDEIFPLAYAVFLCREHSDLPGDPTFMDNLLNILLSP